MSSNATTWTADQTRDMTFELLAANYTETTRTINLGHVTVTAATDLVLLSGYLLPSSDCRVEYRLTFPDATVKMVTPDQPVQLLAAITGNVGIAAILTGTAYLSPILLPGTQLLWGVMGTTGTYISRAMLAGSNVSIKVIVDVYLPSSAAAIAVDYKGVDGGDTYATVPFSSSLNLDDGWVEMTYIKTAVTETSVHVRLSLSGTPAARPFVSGLRMYVM
jgi:hypothetical protein